MLFRCRPLHPVARAYRPRPPFRPLTRRCYAVNAAPSHDVAIVGGGITGLASAYYLTRALPNARITVYEATDCVGGWLASQRVPVRDGTVLFEPATRTFRTQGNGALTASLVQELDLAKDAIFTCRSSPAASNRYIYYPDHLVRVPDPSHGFMRNAWSLSSEPAYKSLIWSCLTEFRKPVRQSDVQDESVGDFFSRRLSKNVVDRVLSAVIHGIYAGDVYQLSARSLFPALWSDEANHGSLVLGAFKSRKAPMATKRDAAFLQDINRFEWDPWLMATLKQTAVFTFRDGAKALPDRLYTTLCQRERVDFQMSTRVTSVRQAEGNTGVFVATTGSNQARKHTHVISTLSPWQLNEIAKDGSGEHLVGQVPAVTVMVVNLYFRTPGLHKQGFGYLIPLATPFEMNPERALGVVFDTSYSPGPQHGSPSDCQKSHDDVIERARKTGEVVKAGGFAWHNMPEKLNHQDTGAARGSKVTVMLGGHLWDGWPTYPDEKEGLALARSLLERHLGIKEEPEAWAVHLQANCIPQYTIGHEQRLRDAHDAIAREFRGRLRVAGSWISGVGVNDCVRSGYEVANNLTKAGCTGLEHVGEEATVLLEQARIRKK